MGQGIDNWASLRRACDKYGVEEYTLRALVSTLEEKIRDGQELRTEIERLAASFEHQSYEDWTGEELADLMHVALDRNTSRV